MVGASGATNLWELKRTCLVDAFPVSPICQPAVGLTPEFGSESRVPIHSRGLEPGVASQWVKKW